MIAVIKELDLVALITAIGASTALIIRAIKTETRPRELDRNGKMRPNGKRLGETVASIEAKLDGHLEERKSFQPLIDWIVQKWLKELEDPEKKGTRKT